MTGSASLNSPFPLRRGKVRACPRIKYGASSELDSGMGVIHPLRETPSHLNPPPQWGEEVDFHGNCPWPLRATYEDENDMASSPSLPPFAGVHAPPLDSGLRRNDGGGGCRTLQGVVGEPRAGYFHNNDRIRGRKYESEGLIRGNQRTPNLPPSSGGLEAKPPSQGGEEGGKRPTGPWSGCQRLMGRSLICSPPSGSTWERPCWWLFPGRKTPAISTSR